MNVRNPYFGSGKPWSGTAAFITPQELMRLAGIEAASFAGDAVGSQAFSGSTLDTKASDTEGDAYGQLEKLRVELTVPSDTRTPAASVLTGGGRAILMVPIKSAVPIANSTTTVASVSTQLNALLAQLRLSGMLPS